MNTSNPPAHPLEQMVSRLAEEAEAFARRDPAQAAAVAFGLGLLIHVIPKRFLVSSATSIGLTLLKPALLTFGVVKLSELYLSQTKNHTRHE